MNKRDNYQSQMRAADAIHSARAQRKLNDKYLARGGEKDLERWQSFLQQQQQTFGFANVGGGLTIPAAAAWLAAAWDNTATYPAGVGGAAVSGSYVQVNGVTYSAPAAAPASGTAPPGSTWVIVPPPPGAQAWQANPLPKQSVWANPQSNFPQPPATAVDVVDSAYQIPDTQVASTTVSQWYIPAPGRALLVAAAASGFPILQANIAGSWTNILVFTAATMSWVELDGLSWRVITAASTPVRQTYTLYRVRQSIQ